VWRSAPIDAAILAAMNAFDENKKRETKQYLCARSTTTGAFLPLP